MPKNSTNIYGVNMKIVVTGGAGFIGSHLCNHLLKAGHEVICVDNFFTGSRKNILDLMGNKNFEVIRHDIIIPLYVDCDRIYNLACPASPVHYQFNPIKTIKCNTVGMVNILELAKRTKARILQASTSEVYGDPKEHPQKENYWGNVNPVGVRSCYDEGKRVAEALCMGYHRQNEVDVRIARIFNTFGPNMAKNDGRVISNFIIQALENKPLTVYGKGSQTRSFCYVSDLVEGLVNLMEGNAKGPVNLGNPAEITILDLAKKIVQVTGSKSKIEFRPLPQGDPVKRKPDISLAKKEIKWEPKTQLDDGLKSTINYFKELIRNG